jgi:hypothetical protein
LHPTTSAEIVRPLKKTDAFRCSCASRYKGGIASMTIVVAVASPDGIVLAADSRTTTFPEGAAPGARTRVLSDTALKVFEVAGQYSVATFGQALIGPQTIAGIMAEFAAESQAEVLGDIHTFANALGAFFTTRYTAWRESVGHPIGEDEPTGALGFLVGGYDTAGVGHVVEVHVPHGELVDGVGISTAEGGGVIFRGQIGVINRLLRGVDVDALAATGVTVPHDIVTAMGQLQYEVLFPITIQDAIDLSAFLIRTTIDMQRFSDGIVADPGEVPACGGEVVVLATRRAEVEWVSRPALTLPTKAGRAEGEL